MGDLRWGEKELYPAPRGIRVGKQRKKFGVRKVKERSIGKSETDRGAKENTSKWKKKIERWEHAKGGQNEKRGRLNSKKAEKRLSRKFKTAVDVISS